MSENSAVWLRRRDGMLFGVCKGLAPKFGLKVGAFRVLWLLTCLCAGAGVGFYFLLAICLPREDRAFDVNGKRILGVCAAIARRNHVNVALVRFIALCSLFFSFGTTLIGYVILHFVMKDDQDSSASNPATPPATTHTLE